MTQNSVFSACEDLKLPLSAIQWHEAVKQGFPESFLKKICGQLKISKKELKGLLDLELNSDSEILSTQDSDVLYRLGVVVDTLTVNGMSFSQISAYLQQPDPFFKDRKPIDLLKNFQGYSYLLNKVKGTK